MLCTLYFYALHPMTHIFPIFKTIVNTPKIVNTFYTLPGYSRCEKADKQGIS